MIVQYFIMKNNNINIEFINASNKLKHISMIEKKDKLDYRERKKLSIKICQEIITNNYIFNEWYDFFNNTKKKDDLSDCFLQGYWYINNKLIK